MTSSSTSPPQQIFLTTSSRSTSIYLSFLSPQAPHYPLIITSTSPNAPINLPSHLDCCQLLHEHSILQVQPLAVATWCRLLTHGIHVDRLQLHDGEPHRCSVVLQLLDVVSQPLLILTRELCVTAARC